MLQIVFACTDKHETHTDVAATGLSLAASVMTAYIKEQWMVHKADL